MPDLPTSSVTFLFTDLVGSTRLWEEDPDGTRSALIRHDALIEALVEQHAGTVVRPRGEGDSRFAVFARPSAAVAAACAIQRAVARETWSSVRPLQIRLALHTGEADFREGDYYGSEVNRCARLRGIAHGGQTLLSSTVATAVRQALPPAASLKDLGKHRLKDLSEPEWVFQLLHPELPAEFPPLNSLENFHHNLLVQPTPLIGRDQELSSVLKLLESGARLVTLTGPGGTGKTRLGIQAAAELIDRFKDGVFFVSLAPVNAPELLVSAITETLGVREIGERPLLETLKEYLADKQVLLDLDNFEHILTGATLVAELLAACPKLVVLVTSRAALRLRGEKEFPVPPLALPERSPRISVDVLRASPAVELFTQRATDAKPDFAITADNAPTVAEICRRLDGLPLAIELAAARVKLLPPQALLVRLERRLPLLTGGARDLPARQQTLRATIAWSYDLLVPAEQVLFRRMAVFADGGTLEAVAAACAPEIDELDVLDRVGSLIDRSLMRQEEQENGEPRLVMLETIREYGLEQLAANGDEYDARLRHAQYFLEYAEEIAPKLWGDDADACMARLDVEHANLRTTLGWAVDGAALELGLRLGGALWRFWEVRSHLAEGRRWLERALEAAPDAPAAIRAEACTGAGTMAWYQGDYARAAELHAKCLALSREIGDRRGIAFALNNLGAVALEQGNYAPANELFEECLIRARELGDKRLLLYGFHNLGEVARHRGDYDHAIALYGESLSISHELGDRWAAALNLSWLGITEHLNGDHERALTHLIESLVIHQTLEDQPHTIGCLEGLAAVAHSQAAPERAARLFGAAEALRETIDLPVPPGNRSDYDREVAAVRAMLANEAFFAAWSAGRAMSLERAIELALGVPTTS